VSALAEALAGCGGTRAPREHAARLRSLLAAELDRGAVELERKRSGYDGPIVVAVAPWAGSLLAVAPVAPALAADPQAAGERAWLLVAALVGALVEATGAGPAARPSDLTLLAGSSDRRLALALPARAAGDPAASDLAELAELVPLAFEDEVAPVNRLRARALALPEHALAEPAGLRPPIGAAHPLRIAEAVARLGGRPADEESLAEHEEAVLALLQPADAVARPHADPDPARRAARRILQRLAGMGKWGGYHTEFAHLARGFAGHEQGLALDVGERLLAVGLLLEKPSVGQRHVFLNPRRAADVTALVERGELPPDLDLPG
jgi:hypothetical protein